MMKLYIGLLVLKLIFFILLVLLILFSLFCFVFSCFFFSYCFFIYFSQLGGVLMYKSKYKFFLIPLLVLFVIFSFKLSVSAEGSIYFPMRQNQNNIYSERDITQIEHFLSPSTNYYFCWVKSIGGGQHQYYYIKWPKSSNAGIIATTSGYQFTLSYYGSASFTYGYLDIKTQNNYHGNYESYVGNNPSVYLQGNKNSSVYSNNVSYLSNISIYDSTNVDTRHVVLIYGNYIEVPTQGHAVSPSGSTPAFNYPIGMHPTAAPTVPTYTAPTLNTAPSIDTTNINTLVQSVFDLLSWGIVSIVQYFITLINVILDWFDFLGNLLLYIVSYIIDLYNAFVDWMYRLYTALFEPIYNFFNDFFGFLFNENDQKSVYDLLKELKTSVSNGFTNLWSNSFINGFWSDFDTNLSPFISDLITAFTKVIGFFAWLYDHGLDNSNEFSIIVLFNYLFVPEPYQVVNLFYNHDTFNFVSFSTDVVGFVDSFKIQYTNASTSYVITLDSFSLAGVTIPQQQIDFSWYLPYKSTGDAIISAFLIFGYFMFLFFRLPYYLRGQAGDSTNVIQEVHR